MKNLNSPRASAFSHAERTLAALALLLLAGCSHPPEGPEADTKAFALSDTMLSRIALDTVRSEPVMSTIDLNGRVTADEDRVADIFPIVGGQVLSVDCELGDRVQKDQTLAVIRSSEVADYERQLIDAQSDVQVAEKNVKVQQDMFDSKLVSERELLGAQQDLAKAQAELKRIKEAFTIYHLQDGSQYVVKAPIGGYVVAKAITRDVTLPADHNERIFSIAQLDEVWVLANVYESDIARVKEGMPADITVLSYPDKVFHGKVDKIFNILDPTTRTMSIRVKLPNEGTLLKPEMVAHVQLTYAEDRSLPVIPASAVVFDNSRDIVMVFHDRYNVETREVKLDRTASGKSWIAEGLKIGETIVSKQQLFIYDALNDR
ncbi:MAG TPA: efflux RND transporter periplasmic adaptor subunit [Flavobacteriales bacterium]|jgi:cobalt-zinc-cadmium efflux system membrane fusion protein|nr:efflux RND transporter periplasmic adaptor subunit [Flavobacteriales bacterium]